MQKILTGGSMLTTPKCKELYEAGLEASCGFQSTVKPTYWPTDTKRLPDLINFFTIKGISDNYVQMSEGNDLISDHSPVILTIRKTLVQRDDPPRLTNKWTDWEWFTNDLENLIKLRIPLKTPQQLEEEADLFVTHIQEAAWNNTPTTRKIYNSQNIIYPHEVRKLLREKGKYGKHGKCHVHHKIKPN